MTQEQGSNEVVKQLASNRLFRILNNARYIDIIPGEDDSGSEEPLGLVQEKWIGLVESLQDNLPIVRRTKASPEDIENARKSIREELVDDNGFDQYP